MFGWLFGKKKRGETANNPKSAVDEPEYDEAAELAWYEAKSAFMVEALGEEYDMVMHAIIPYSVGGGLDLYYYPNGIEGTAIATKELVDADRKGPSNRVYPAYELAMFTRHPFDMGAAQNPSTPFGKIHKSMNGMLNAMARYAEQATLNPFETCEFPDGFGDLSHRCVVLNGLVHPDKAKAFGMGLMAVIEVHRSELDFARANGGAALIERLEAAGHLPYSDLDRDPVA